MPLKFSVLIRHLDMNSGKKAYHRLLNSKNIDCPWRARMGIPANPASQEFLVGIPGNYWILGENIREFWKFPLLFLIVKARYHENSVFLLFSNLNHQLLDSTLLVIGCPSVSRKILTTIQCQAYVMVWSYNNKKHWLIILPILGIAISKLQ